MRLWHKDLIPVLPRQQLLGQWRECCLIARSIAQDGTPGHLLVNSVMDYPIEHFYAYALTVCREMNDRGYRCDFGRFTAWIDLPRGQDLGGLEIFPEWHNDRYLQQCFYNLQEKFDCGGIDTEDYDRIGKEVSKLLQQRKGGRAC